MADEKHTGLIIDDDDAKGGAGAPSPSPSKHDMRYPVGALMITAVPSAVDVHPLVLLSVVDHFARINVNVETHRRVVGLLLGYLTVVDGETHLDVNNSFAVPFDEDPRDPSVWFFDTNFGEDMLKMYRKVLPELKVVGWYSSGPDISGNDLDVHLMVAERFCPNPVYCMVNTNPAARGVPVLTYVTTEAKGAKSVEFRNVLSSIVSLEAEEIGVEHLLRDLTDSTITTLSTKIGDRQLALGHLEGLLGIVEQYLYDVADGKLPICTEVLSLLQELTNWLPTVHAMKRHTGMLIATNDQELCTFLASVARAVAALYDVICNRRKLRREVKAKRDAETKAAEEAAKAAAAKAAAAATDTSDAAEGTAAAKK